MWACDLCGATKDEVRLFRYGASDLCAKCIAKVDEEATASIVKEYGEQWCEDNFKEVDENVD